MHAVVNCSAERSDEARHAFFWREATTTKNTLFVRSTYLERRDDGGGGPRLEPRLLLRRRRRRCLLMPRSGIVVLHAPMAGSSSSHPIHNRRHTTHLRSHTHTNARVSDKKSLITRMHMIYTSLIDQRSIYACSKLIYTYAHHDKHCISLIMITSIDTHNVQQVLRRRKSL
jgi:hypothetical protein